MGRSALACIAIAFGRRIAFLARSITAYAEAVFVPVRGIILFVIVNELHLLQEAGGHIPAVLAVQHARTAIQKIKLLLRACDADVAETALLFQTSLIIA